MRKHVCREEFLDNSVTDLQRQLDSTRLEIHSTNQGYEESREEQARLHDELAQGERVLRETQIRSVHEVGALKRAQEMGIDESSRNELRESHATMQELISHTLELQEKVSFVNDSAEFQDVQSICSGKLSHVHSQPAVVPSPRSMLSRDQSLRPDTWNLSGTQGNVFGSARAVIDSSQTPYRGILHSLNQRATGGNPVQKSTGRPVAKGEEQIGSTKPMPSFSRRPSTMNSFFPAEVPQNSMADQQRLQISENHFGKLPTPSAFSCYVNVDVVLARLGSGRQLYGVLFTCLL